MKVCTQATSATTRNLRKPRPRSTVDDLERKVLDDKLDHDQAAAERRRASESHEPAYEQDKDVEDLPGGAGEPGGSSYEPPS